MNAISSDRRKGQSERSVEIVSWVLFFFSAVFFVISALRSGDVPGLIGALLFLLACAIFLLPHVTRAFSASGRNANR